MPIYYYKAKKGTETVFGQVTAANQDEALEMMNHSGLVPVTLDVKTSVHQADTGRGSVGRKEIYIFTKQLLSLITAGTSILRALELLRAQTGNPYFRTILSSMSQDIRDGRSFSESLNDYPKIFSSLFVNLVRAGEETGKLKEVLRSLADYQRDEGELAAKVKSAFAYPIFMAGVGVLTVIFVLVFVLPKITALFTSLDTLPLPTKILMDTSDFLKVYWIWVVVAICALVSLLGFYKKTPAGQRLISALKLKTPIFGPLVLKLELARLCRTLEILLKSDVPVLKAIQVALPILENDLLRAELMRAHRGLTSGDSFGAGLRKSKLIPSLMSDLIAVGEESGSLGTIFSDIAEMYEQDTREAIKTMTSLLEPIMILVVGSVIAFIVFAMLLPIFQVDVFAR